MADHRKIHSAEIQTGMHIPPASYRPACWTDDATPRAPTFHDHGRACGAAMTPAVWQVTLEHTPGCSLCQRASRALALCAGVET
jgi:hypothetical protein